MTLLLTRGTPTNKKKKTPCAVENCPNQRSLPSSCSHTASAGTWRTIVAVVSGATCARLGGCRFCTHLAEVGVTAAAALPKIPCSTFTASQFSLAPTASLMARKDQVRLLACAPGRCDGRPRCAQCPHRSWSGPCRSRCHLPTVASGATLLPPLLTPTQQAGAKARAC